MKRSHSLLSALVLAALVGTAAPAWAQGAEGPVAAEPSSADEEAPRTRPKVAVMDLARAEGVSEDLAVGIAGLVATRLDGLRVFEVISESDVRALVSFDALRTALATDDETSQLAAIGKALGARYLIAGRVFQGPLRADLVLFDLERMRALRRESVTAETRAALTRPLLRGVDRLVAPVLAEQTATLLVRTSEEGATISLDGDVIGTSPMRPREVGSGPHTLTVTKDGFVKAELDVVLQPGQTAPVEVLLVPSKELVEAYEREAWLWRGTSYALLGGGAATLLGGLSLLAWNEVRTTEIANLTGQASAGVLRLRPGHYGELLSYRVGGGVLLAGVTPALVLAGTFVYFAFPAPGRYDGLVANAEGE